MKFKVIQIVLISVGVMLSAWPAYSTVFFWGETAEDRRGWYMGLEIIRFYAYDSGILWTHTDVPLECDQWFEGALPVTDKKCSPFNPPIFVSADEHFQSNILFPGIHVGRAWKFLRLEVDYFFREHLGYSGVAPFSRGGSFAEELDFEPYNFRLNNRSKEFFWSRERISEKWAQCFFLNTYYDLRGIPGPFVPYVGFGAGLAYMHAYYSAILQRNMDREALASIGVPPDAAGTITAANSDLYDLELAYQYLLGLDVEIRNRMHIGIKTAYMNIPNGFEDRDMFDILRGHGTSPAPAQVDSWNTYWWELPTRFRLIISDWETWRIALNLKYLWG